MRTVALRATLVLLAAAGCSSDSPPDPVLVEGIRVTPQSVQLTTIGETRQLTAAISPRQRHRPGNYLGIGRPGRGVCGR